MFYRRKDGCLIDKEISIFNRMIPYIMRGRNESMITLKENLIMTETLKFISENRDDKGRKKFNYFEILLAATLKVFSEFPHMNRFIMDGHYYQRNKLNCAFVIKTKLTIEDPERNVMIQWDEGDTLSKLSKKIKNAVEKGKNVEQDDQEKAMKILFSFPSWIVRIITGALIRLDKKGVLPLSMTDLDALHCSFFMANLGSIGLNNAPAHHLFEWGTCSIFVTSGRIKKQLVIDRMGNSSIEDQLNVCFSIDERISEGFYYAKVVNRFKKLIENPQLLM